ncbi:MAG: hypothetical protein JW938_01290 [Candidatus Omnitrophica bacterium]|nr:hypothetical protein [Candidatus Omnitrophota bacterium]
MIRKITAYTTVILFIVTQTFSSSAQLPHVSTLSKKITADAAQDQFKEQISRETSRGLIKLICNETVSFEDIRAYAKKHFDISIPEIAAEELMELVKVIRRFYGEDVSVTKRDLQSHEPMDRNERMTYLKKNQPQKFALIKNLVAEFYQKIEMLNSRSFEKEESTTKDQDVQVGEPRYRDPRDIRRQNPNLAQPDAIRKGKGCHEYRDSEEDFNGVDLEHFVTAIEGLSIGVLSDKNKLRMVMRQLGLDPRNYTPESALQEVYAALVSGKLTKAVIDSIAADNYADPDMDKSIYGQNSNPRQQSILEAVSNGLDALGLEIGKFGKGIKQHVAWLEPTGHDRIDVFTRPVNAPERQWFQLTILKGINGQLYIQLRTRDLTKSQLQDMIRSSHAKKIVNSLEHGTIVALSVENAIPRMRGQGDNPQEVIEDEIHKRFAWVDDVSVFTERIGKEPHEVNGFKEKKVIVGEKMHSKVERHGRVYVASDDNSVVIADNGGGMTQGLLSRMFVPDLSSKESEEQTFTGKKLDAELEKVRVVHDPTLRTRVSIARQKEVIRTIDIPASVNPEAVVKGGLLLEFGRLIGVPEGRDMFNFDQDIKPGQESQFIRAFEHMVQKIIENEEISNAEKVRYINTIVVAFETYSEGNAHYKNAAKAARFHVQDLMHDIVKELRDEGFIVLPHDTAYRKLKIRGKKVIYLHRDLFKWTGADALEDLGSVMVPGVMLEGGRRIILTDFDEDTLRHIAKYDNNWHNMPESERVPVIFDEQFVIFPKQIAQRFYDLQVKALKEPDSFTDEDREAFASLAQRINIITASQVITSYEVGQRQINMRLDALLIESKLDDDEYDRIAREQFLTQPPVPGMTEDDDVSEGDKQVLFVNEEGALVNTKDGSIIEKQKGNVRELEYLGDGYYVITETIITDSKAVLLRTESLATTIAKGEKSDPDAERSRGLYRLTEDGDLEEIESPFVYRNYSLSHDGQYILSRLGPNILNALYHKQTGKQLEPNDLADKAGYHGVGYFTLSPDGKYALFEATSPDDPEMRCVVLYEMETEEHVIVDTFQHVKLDVSIPEDGIPWGTDTAKKILGSVLKKRARSEFSETSDEIFLYKTIEGVEDAPYKIARFSRPGFEGGASLGDYQVITDLRGIYANRESPLRIYDFGNELRIFDTVTGEYLPDSPMIEVLKSGEKIIGLAKVTKADDGQKMDVLITNRNRFVFYVRPTEEHRDATFGIFDTENIKFYAEETIINADVVSKSLKLYDNDNVYVKDFTNFSRPYSMEVLNKGWGYMHPQYPHLWVARDAEDPRPGRKEYDDGYVIDLTNDHRVAEIEPDDNVIYHKPGGVIVIQQQEEIVVDMVEHIWRFKGVPDSTTEARYVVGRDTEGYYIVDLHDDDPRGQWEEKINVSAEYSEVSYHGGYFAFFNPETNDVIYIDPAEPDKATKKRQKLFSPMPPNDTNIIVYDETTNGSGVVTNGTLSRHLSLRVEKLVPISEHGVLVYESDKYAKNRRQTYVARRERMYDYLGNDMARQSGEKAVEAIREGYVCYSEDEPYDLEHEVEGWSPDFTRIAFRFPGDDVQIVPGGRYMVITPYDVENNPRIRIFDRLRDDSQTKDYLQGVPFKRVKTTAHENHLIVEMENGQYRLYNIEKGDFIGDEYDITLVESHGGYAIQANEGQNECVITHLQSGRQKIVMSDDSFYFGSDGDQVYCSYASMDNERHYVHFDNENNEFVDHLLPRMIDFMPDSRDLSSLDECLERLVPYGIRFWREYHILRHGLHHKLIRDLMQDKEVDISGRKFINDDPFNAQHEDHLYGNMYIYVTRPLWFHKEDQDVLFYEGIDLETGQSWRCRAHNDTIMRREPMKGHKIWFFQDKNHLYHVPLFGESNNRRYFNLMMNNDHTFMIGSELEAGGAYDLIDEDGNVYDISFIVPEGYRLTDRYGEYFIFSDPKGNPYQVDPARLKKIMLGQGEEAQDMRDAAQEYKKQGIIINKFQNTVLPSRDKWITQAREIYNALFSVIPEGFENGVKTASSQFIKKMYAEQDAIIYGLFDTMLEKNETGLDLSKDLPFDIYAKRLQTILPYLEKYITKLHSTYYIAGISSKRQQEAYQGLFSFVFGLILSEKTIDEDVMFELTATYGLKTEQVYTRLFDAALHGLQATNMNEYHLAIRAGRIIEDLKYKYRSGISYDGVSTIIGFMGKQRSHSVQSIMIKQLDMIFSLSASAYDGALGQWYDSFSEVRLEDLLSYQKMKEASDVYLGDARAFVIILTMDTEFVRKKEMKLEEYIPEGEDADIDEGKIYLSQIAQYEKLRKKKGPDDKIMSIEKLLQMIQAPSKKQGFLQKASEKLPPVNKRVERKIMALIRDQREAGAYTAEIAQNSADAGSPDLVVDFYTHKNPETGVEEYVEEAVDRGSGALAEVALLIPFSTKADDRQKNQTGRYGIGKYTIYRNVDRVEIITNNGVRAFMFTVTVEKDENGTPLGIALTRVRKLNPALCEKGVTIRRIKERDLSIPELEYILAERAWKTNTANAHSEKFKVLLVDHQGKKKPVIQDGEREVLSESRIAFDKKIEDPIFRIVQTKDMPNQVVDKLGLRVKNIPDEYLALVPWQLREQIAELGINIQIPLPPNSARNGFKEEPESMVKKIQKFVAIEMYKAMAYKVLTQDGTPFSLGGLFPQDWDSNVAYDKMFNTQEKMIQFADKVDAGKYDEIPYEYLEQLMPREDMLDKQQLFIKFLALLKVNAKGEKISLLDRRIKITGLVDKKRAEKMKKVIESAGGEVKKFEGKDLPHLKELLFQAEFMHKVQNENPNSYAIPEEEYEEKHKKLKRFAEDVFAGFSEIMTANVVIVNENFSAPGCFSSGVVYLNENITDHLQGLYSMDITTDTIIHEMAHFLEKIMYASEQDIQRLLKTGYRSHDNINMTHTSKGTFGECMKYISLRSLAYEHGFTIPEKEGFRVDDDMMQEVFLDQIERDEKGEKTEYVETRESRTEALIENDARIIIAA